jgi:hypothetical protein
MIAAIREAGRKLANAAATARMNGVPASSKTGSSARRVVSGGHPVFANARSRRRVLQPLH